jgi:hypothetical protein
LHYLGDISRQGGVLIAADTQLSVVSSAGHQLAVWGERVSCADEKATHGGWSDCPYVVPVAPADAKDTLQLFKGLDRIATNSSSFITVSGWGGDCQHELAAFPPGCTYGRFQNRLRPNMYFAVGGEGPDFDTNNGLPYRFLMMADHSVFINQMLLEPGTQNLELAYRVIDYLQGSDKRRKRCLFYENGQYVDHFDDLRLAAVKQNQTALPQVNLWGMQEKLTDLGNTILDRLQTSDVHNKLLFGSGRDPEEQYYALASILRFFLVLGSVYACWFVLRRAWGARKPNDAPPPPVVAGAPTGPPGVFERRQKELLRRNNVYEPVRDLVREFFETIGVRGDQGPRMPKMVVSDVVRKPDSLRAAVRDLWRLAFGPPQALTVSRWRELEPYFGRVRQAHADGKWRFVLAEAVA